MSDSEGRAPIPNDVEDGEHKLLVTKGDEYVKTEGTFVLDKGEVISTPQLSLPKKVDFERIKIVLDWGEYPYDLDAHIVDSNFHVYYGNMKKGKLELDIDDVSSFGPETITIKEPSVTDVYKYYVYNYSDGGNVTSNRLSNSETQIKIYIDIDYKHHLKLHQISKE